MLAMIGGYATDIFLGNGVKFGLVAGAIIALVMWDYGRISKLERAAESRGGQKVINQVSKANARSTKVGTSSARNSGKPNTRGVRSPRYRD